MATIKAESLFLSVPSGPVHTTLVKLKKWALISVVGSTVQTNPSQKRYFSKTLFKPEEFN